MSNRRDPLVYKLPRFARGPLVWVSRTEAVELRLRRTYSISSFDRLVDTVWVDARRLKRERRRARR